MNYSWDWFRWESTLVSRDLNKWRLGRKYAGQTCTNWEITDSFIFFKLDDQKNNMLLNYQDLHETIDFFYLLFMKYIFELKLRMWWMSVWLGLSSTLTWDVKKADFPTISKRGEKYPKMFWGALGVPIYNISTNEVISA